MQIQGWFVLHAATPAWQRLIRALSCADTELVPGCQVSRYNQLYCKKQLSWNCTARGVEKRLAFHTDIMRLMFFTKLR